MLDISLFLSLEPHATSGMSIFQMDNFVIEDHITPYRKLRQAIVESKARLENITSIGFDLEELELKKEEAIDEQNKASIKQEHRLAKLQDIAVRRLDFEINRKKALLVQMNHEVTFFLKSISNIVDSDFGGPVAAVALMSNDIFQHTEEKNFWTKKLTRGVCSDLVNYGTISKGLMESISCLPEKQREEILNEATAMQLSFVKQLNSARDVFLIGTD